jgi:hypothetical protein
VRVHELKCWPEPFQATWDGGKTHEVRVDDRGYRAGDRLLLREYDPTRAGYTGREVLADVTYVTGGGTFGLALELAVLSTRVVSRTSSGPAVVLDNTRSLAGAWTAWDVLRRAVEADVRLNAAGVAAPDERCGVARVERPRGARVGGEAPSPRDRLFEAVQEYALAWEEGDSREVGRARSAVAEAVDDYERHVRDSEAASH